MELFYHDKKEHMSPSAMSSWFNSRSNFIKSYFDGERGPETKAMKAGTAIHRLVEAGLIPAKCVYDNGEQEIKVQVPGSAFYFMGKPDSHESKATDGMVNFVDYKSGKANDWKEKLPTDLKMKATAWLVWMKTEQPEKVHGFIEYIPTTWDPEAKEVVPVDGKETELIDIIYTSEELEAFTGVIIKTMNEVNDFYEKWKESTGEFVNEEDIERYLELNTKAELIEAEMDEIKQRIMDQMEFGGVMNHKIDAGTFYITERETYAYPEELQIGGDMTLKDAEEVATKAKTAKKNFELINDPVSTSKSVGFRGAKAKK